MLEQVADIPAKRSAAAAGAPDAAASVQQGCSGNPRPGDEVRPTPTDPGARPVGHCTDTGGPQRRRANAPVRAPPPPTSAPPDSGSDRGPRPGSRTRRPTEHRGCRSHTRATATRRAAVGTGADIARTVRPRHGLSGRHGLPRATGAGYRSRLGVIGAGATAPEPLAGLPARQGADDPLGEAPGRLPTTAHSLALEAPMCRW